MFRPIPVTPAVQWVGALDFDIRVFDVVMRTDNGTTYNAYLVKGGEKTVLIETVKEAFFGEFRERLEEAAGLPEIDYIVINHAEPDHSGSLARLLPLAPKAVVLGTGAALAFAKKVANADFPSRAVKDGETIDIGGMELRFIHAPFMHWPDTMFTYIPEIGALFTCDAFGCHYCDARLFNDAIEGDFLGAYRYYFDNIMGPFKPHVLAALEKLRGLDVRTICNSHGPVIRENPRNYIEMYREWAAPVKNDP
ncbi:MAG: FprA family A-type flavoprotein, partial [Firmicutes bacterium]|nr:FprA family A-type flavoprotein [Bacillota bacterium]